ncbi:hypothetical protein PV327_011110 [Microctonus hyperodae]|uniref:Uncharacterized protein n=1 Tax=Microctonus hyperodae TaxID=165561 RepID=A0AA39F087_MICHY|nr:hypothetical protein PV327_011110 [Microctonus hyperodae]
MWRRSKTALKTPKQSLFFYSANDANPQGINYAVFLGAIMTSINRELEKIQQNVSSIRHDFYVQKRNISSMNNNCGIHKKNISSICYDMDSLLTVCEFRRCFENSINFPGSVQCEIDIEISS